MYLIDEPYRNAEIIGEYIKNGHRYKIYQYNGYGVIIRCSKAFFTFEALFEYLRKL